MSTPTTALNSTLATLPPGARARSDAASAPRTPSMARWAVLAMGLALAVIWLVVLSFLGLKWRDAIDGEREHDANLVRILQEQTVRVVAATDQATLRLRDAVRAGEFDLHDIGRFANETGLAPKILTQLSLVGPDGRFLGSNLDPDGSKSGHVDLSSREHVAVHLSPGRVPDAPPLSEGGLFIGKPVLGKVSGKWTIQLSRRIEAADGKLLGVVVASLDPLYFEQIYRSVALGTQGGVALMGSDRNVRARVIGGVGSGMGSTLKPDGADASLAGDAGQFEAASSFDGVQRMVTFRRAAPYPLYVAVLKGVDEALEGWRDTRNMALALCALLTLALVAAAANFALGVRRLEESNRALRQSEAQAHAANQAKSEFLAAISHELRTPLTSIRGFAELMEVRIAEPRFREQASLIRKAAEYLNALLTEILDLAKVDAGAMKVELQPVALRPLVDGVASFFAVTAAEKKLHLEVHFAPDLPERVRADELRLKQVLNNLLSNAFKFTSEGSVGIEVDRDGTALCVHVVDTGPGIPVHLHELIFERFRQADAQVSYQHGGTGLGLALSRALAELMGGTLTVQSTLGAGSRFTLRLPAA